MLEDVLVHLPKTLNEAYPYKDLWGYSKVPTKILAVQPKQLARCLIFWMKEPKGWYCLCVKTGSDQLRSRIKIGYLEGTWLFI